MYKLESELALSKFKSLYAYSKVGVHVTKAAVAMLYSSQINPTFQAALFFMTSCTVDLVFVCDLIVNSVP